MPASKLYCVTIRVKPLPRHPAYWDVQAGYLRVFVWALEMDDAGDAAFDCLEALSFEPVGSRIKVHEPLGPGLSAGDLSPVVREKVDEAQRLGFSWLLIAWPPGGDETGFEDEWEAAEC